TVPRNTYEIIVVDDGSTDQTRAVAERPDVIVLSQTNQGPAAARNAGARKASGELLLFTDSDCVPDRHWLDEMTAPFREPDVMGVKGVYRTRQRGLAPRFVQCEFEERYAKLKRRPSIDFVDTYSAAFRTDAFWKVGGFDPAFPYADHEDVDFAYRMAGCGYKMVFNPRAFVYTEHPDSIGAYFRLKFGRGYWRTVVYRRFPRKAFRDSYTPQTLKLQILLTYGIVCGVLAGILSGSWGILGGLYLLFLASAVPFSYRASRRDPVVALVSPFFLLVRSAAIGLGIIWAALRSFLGRTSLRESGAGGG
ncbi:MAG: glycosyltransferase, partial [Acidobacteriota bacterium]